MRLFTCLLLWLLLLMTIVPSQAASEPKTPASRTNMESAENWDLILARWNSQMTRTLQLLEKYRIGFGRSTENYEQFQATTRTRMEELRFLLNFCMQQDVFEMTLRCQQIHDLYAAYRDRHQRIVKFRDGMNQLAAHLKDLKAELARIEQSRERFANPELLADCAQKYAELEKNVIRISSPLQVHADPALFQQLQSLYEESDKIRSATIDQVFFSRQTTYFELLPVARVILQYWYWTLLDTAQAVLRYAYFPVIRNFLLVFLPLLLAALFTGPRYLYPWMLRQVRFPDKYSKSKMFVIAWMLLCLALAFGAGRFLQPEDLQSFMYQISQFLCAGALLMLSLGFRMERGQMRRCMLLYTPLMLQSAVALLLYGLLTPYQPLMLLTVPINVLVILATLLLLRRGGYPKFDVALVIIALCITVLETALAVEGLLYIGFTMMLIGYVLLAQFQAAVAASEIIYRTAQSRPERAILNLTLMRLGIPLIWLGVLRTMVGNVAVTYHLESFLEYWTQNDIRVRDLFSFTLSDLYTIVIALFVLAFLISLSKLLIRKFYPESAEFGTVPSFVTLGTYIAWACYVLFVLLILNVQYASILVILGGLSMGMGFALKEVLENFISGIILLVGQQVRPGDEIEFDGTYAKVHKVSFRATVIETFDGSVITLPNTQVLSKDFRNWTRRDRRMRRDLVVGVDYASDPGLVRKLLLQAAAETTSIYRYPAPEVFCTDFADSSVNFTLRVWLEAGESVRICSNLRERIFNLFRENGIVIPFPQLDVHFDPPPAPQEKK